MIDPISDHDWAAFCVTLRRVVEAIRGCFEELVRAFPREDIRRQLEGFGEACREAAAADRAREHRALLLRCSEQHRPRRPPRLKLLVAAPAWTTSLRAFCRRG